MRTSTLRTILLFCALSATPLAAQEPEIHLDYAPKPAIAGQEIEIIISGVVEFYPRLTFADVTDGVILFEFEDSCQPDPILGPIPCEPGPFQLVVPVTGLEPGVYQVIVREFDQDAQPIDHTLELRVLDPDGCIPSETVLCLNQGRFRLQVEWEDFSGDTGVGRAVPFLADDPAGSDTGFFWFFDPLNLELMIKVLDACRFRDRFWVFVASASTVAYQITVEDTLSGKVKTYTNELGQTPALIPDTDAFATCP